MTSVVYTVAVFLPASCFAFRFGFRCKNRNVYLLYNGIIGSGGIVLDTIDQLKGTFGFCGDAIVRLVVREQAPV